MLIEPARKAQTVQNLVLLSSAGCDFAERDAQPRLREFIDLEALAMQPKGEPETVAPSHSPCIIRAGFYAENLLLYSKQAQGEGRLPIPVGDRHKFAPIALGDVAQLAAFVITSEGPHGLADNVRSQVLVATGEFYLPGLGARTVNGRYMRHDRSAADVWGRARASGVAGAWDEDGV